MREKLVPLGKYWRTKPLVFSLLPRCQGLRGSTAMIAHYIESVLLPQCDVVIDVHSGGQSLQYVPSTHIRRSPDPDRFARACTLMEAFNAPFSWVFEGARETRALNAAAERCGIIALGTRAQRRRHRDAAGPAHRRARSAPGSGASRRDVP
jgi:predicted deacylase